ncbi:MAG TPA: hypothetical protein VF390_02020 [Patescibacteria group bacterium]
MALKKTELLGALPEEHRKAVESVERLIDGRLKMIYIGHEVTVDLVGSIHRRAQLELECRYRAAGWDITFHQEPGAGNFIRLK